MITAAFLILISNSIEIQFFIASRCSHTGNFSRTLMIREKMQKGMPKLHLSLNFVKPARDFFDHLAGCVTFKTRQRPIFVNAENFFPIP
jgi:hypothetical protein